MSIRSTAIAFTALATLAAPMAHAQSSDQIIYDDSLESGWQNYGWATLNYANTAFAQGGAKSISVTAAAWQALYVHHTAFDSSQFTAVTFWINGGAPGGQHLAIQGLLNGAQQTAVPIATLAANTWTQVTVPLTALHVDNRLTLDGFWITDTTGHAQPTFYVDNISLIASTTPPRTDAALTVDTTAPIRTIDSRIYGLNTAIWDGNLTWTSTQRALAAANNPTLRFPGGSSSDGYDWTTGKTAGSTYRWPATFPMFAKLAEATSAKSYVTVNYGNGTPQMAAAWVAYANGSATSTLALGTDANSKNWNTVGHWAALRGASPLATDDGYNFLRAAHPAPFNIKYWEIGNECFGSWEYDKHGATGSHLSGTAHDGYTYATWAAQFLTKMRAVDPNIKVGVVVYPWESTYASTVHYAVNPNEGNSRHYGWTPVVLAYLKTANILPDFLIHHSYAQSPGSESDDALLLSPSSWSTYAASLRQMLTDYVGPASGGIELAATETNSVSSSPGKQTTSLVDGLFSADNLANIARTEFNACMWWDLHNGSESHNNSSSLYGWRIFGDYGVLASGDRSDTPINTPYPSYRAMELLTHWGRGGDTLVTAASDYNKLSVYAAKLQNGSLSLLVINKSSASDLTGHFNLGAFPIGAAPAAVYQYGKTEDSAGAGLTASSFPVPGQNFDYLFPAYSMTVIVVPTSAPVVVPTTLALAAVADSYVKSLDAASATHGAETQFVVKRDAISWSNYRRTAYLKFDLTGVTGPITSAQLALTLNSNTLNFQAPLSVYGIADTSWTESTLNWPSALAAGSITADDLSTGTLAATTQVNSTPGVFTWDVSQYLSDKAGQLVTLQLSDPGTGGGYFCFNSKEASSGAPVLTVQY